MKKTNRESTKMISRLISSILLFSSVNSYRLVNIPLNCTNEQTVPIEGIECPVRRNSLRVDHLKEGESLEICKPKLSENDYVPGSLCRMQIWKTKCTETWYFTTTIDYTVEDVTPTKFECSKEWERQKNGFPTIGFFPPAICYWNAENIVKETFVTLTEHQVLEDPYNVQLIDPIFSPRSCTPYEFAKTHKFCTSQNPKILWMSESDKIMSKHCDIKTWECITVKSFVEWDEDRINNNLLKNTTVWEAPDLGRIGLYDACKISFCGVPGIRLGNGEWWYLTKHPHYFGFDLIKMRNCDPKEKIGVRNHIDRTLFEEIDIKIEMENMKCTDTIVKLRSGEDIIPYDLGYLAPSNPGKYYAYRYDQVSEREYLCFERGTGKTVPVELTREKTQCNKTIKGKGPMVGFMSKDRTYPGKFYRAECYYKTVYIPTRDERGVGHNISSWSIPGLNISVEENIKKLNWSQFKTKYKTNTSYHMSWNGMLKDDKENYYIHTYSILDGLIQDIQLSKLEVSGFEHPKYDKYRIDLMTNDEKELGEDETLERTDIIDAAGKKIKAIYNGITGWFSGFASVVRWFLWVIGGIVTVVVIIKIKRMVSEKKDQEEIKNSQEMSFFNKLSKLPSIKTTKKKVPKTSKQLDDTYEMVDFYQ